ncbi:MAG TPA: hydrogenase small subunit [Thermaerobacter sp.]
MTSTRKTIYEELREQGITRREFLKIATAITLSLGLKLNMVPRVAKAMETRPRVPVIWLEFQSCTGCTESFIRSFQPDMQKVLFEVVSLEYSEALMAGSGTVADEHIKKIMEEYPGEYILAAEGSLPVLAGTLTIAGRPAVELFREVAAKAKAVVSMGSCASWGGISAARPNPTLAKAVTDFVPPGVPFIRLPGCPPIAEVMTNTLAHIVLFGTLPEVDELARPKAYYRHRIHDKCQRRAFFDAGLYAEKFNDEGARQGYCLYKLGCRGPTTYAACAELRWNGGLSWPVQSGHPCIGCAAPNFWDQSPFYARVAKLPGTQTTIQPERVGAMMAGALAAGIAVHAAATVIAKGRITKRSEVQAPADAGAGQ